MHQRKHPTKKDGLFYYLLALTILFLTLEFSFFLQGSGLYLGDFKLVANHLHVPLSILPGILFYLSVQLLVHFLFFLFVLGLTRCIVVVIPALKQYIIKLGITLWFFTLITLLLANQFYFPNSKFSHLTSAIASNHWIYGIYHSFFFIFLALSLIGTIGLGIVLMRKLKLTLSLLSIGLLATFGFASHHAMSIQDAGTETKPNIIIIGVDSLRPDFLGFFGGAKRTPFIDNLFDNSTVFSESLTPLARTFPAWVSILTGQYPKLTNVRFNLQSDIHYDLNQTFPALLRSQGYETIFGTDETRFSNIDERFGFDKIITPPIGFNDFLVGTLNDFPLSNLLINSELGELLFPYSYGNRPVFTTYNPNSFINLLRIHLDQPRDKPMLVITHFCLPHYPYIWGNKLARTRSVTNYQLAVQRVDRQLKDYFALLQNAKLLDHSIVIILSDHGEAIELRGDRATDADLFVHNPNQPKQGIPHFYPPALAKEGVNQSAGHGTDVLSMTQYHTVLAIKFYGLKGQEPGVISGRVSLLDIKPTILQLLNIKSDSVSGQSLVPYIQGKKDNVQEKADLFTESDFSPQAVRSVHPETRKILFEGIDFFEINPISARLSVKKSMADMIISSKQFADFHGEWVLALYPQTKQTMMPILVNLNNGYWTNDLHSSFALHSPANSMLTSMKKFFGQDITNVVTSS